MNKDHHPLDWRYLYMWEVIDTCKNNSKSSAMQMLLC